MPALSAALFRVRQVDAVELGEGTAIAFSALIFYHSLSDPRRDSMSSFILWFAALAAFTLLALSGGSAEADVRHRATKPGAVVAGGGTRRSMSFDLSAALRSSVVLVIDRDTGRELFARNAQNVVPIASITKLMTALVVLRSQSALDDVLTITSADVDRLKNSSSRLGVGSSLSRREMLQLALMSSENRAAHALARSQPGGESEFVADMNSTAREIGMENTHFADPTGLSPSNRSNARDLVRLVKAAGEVPLISRLSTTGEHSVGVGRRLLHFRNTNRLIPRNDWDIELQKTGYIDEAGKCLVMQAETSGRSLVLVLLDGRGSSVRVRDAQSIKRWLRVNPADKAPSTAAAQDR